MNPSNALHEGLGYQTVSSSGVCLNGHVGAYSEKGRVEWTNTEVNWAADYDPWDDSTWFLEYYYNGSHTDACAVAGCSRSAIVTYNNSSGTPNNMFYWGTSGIPWRPLDSNLTASTTTLRRWEVNSSIGPDWLTGTRTLHFFKLFDVDMLHTLAYNDLERMTFLSVPWGKDLYWYRNACQTNEFAQDYAEKDLSVNETSMSMTRTQFRISYPTQSATVYRVSWVEFLTPFNSTSTFLRACTTNMIGTGAINSITGILDPLPILDDGRITFNILKVDLDIDGESETEEDTYSSVIVRRFDNNNAPRKKIILAKIEPYTWAGNAILSLGNSKVKVYDAATGGTEIAFNGTDNRFANSALPKDLWVQGDTASTTMRDIPVDFSAEGLTGIKDAVKFTVLWVDIDMRTVEYVSDDNAGKTEYIDRTGADGFGFRIHSCNGALGVEFVGTVHPSDFNHDIIFRRNFLGSKEYSNSSLRSSDLTEAIDTSDSEVRDDAPQSGASTGTIYDLDAPGVLLLAENPGATDARRVNFKEWATYTIGGTDIRCTLERPWYLRINVKMKLDSTFELFNTVIGDNKIDFGTTSLEYNLE